MKTPLLASLLIAAFAAAAVNAAITDLPWDVKTASPKPKLLPLYRGETVTLTPRYLDAAEAPMDLTTVYSVILRYRSAASTGAYYSVTGAVHSATGGTVRLTWSPSAELDADTYNYNIDATSTNGSLLRAFGVIRMLGTVDGVSTSRPPIVDNILDWADISEHRNPESAPFTGPGDLLAIDTRLDGHDASLNTISGRVDSVEAVTSVFAGSGSTGVVTSAAADADKFLKADGTWETPAISSVAWDAITGSPSNLVEEVAAGSGIEISGGNTKTATVAVAESVIAGANAGATSVQPAALGAYATTETVAALDSRVLLIEAWPTNQWSEAYGWGDHAEVGYATGTPVYVESDPVWESEKSGYATAGTVAAIDSRVLLIEAWPTNQWSEAYGWGDHALAEYLTDFSAMTTNDITAAGGVVTNGTEYLLIKSQADAALPASWTNTEGVVRLGRDVKSLYAANVGEYGASFGFVTTAGDYGASFGLTTVAGECGFAAGRRAKGAAGSFIFADGQFDAFTRTNYPNSFAVRVLGGAHFDTPEFEITGNLTADTASVTGALDAGSVEAYSYAQNGTNLFDRITAVKSTADAAAVASTVATQVWDAAQYPLALTNAAAFDPAGTSTALSNTLKSAAFTDSTNYPTLNADTNTYTGMAKYGEVTGVGIGLYEGVWQVHGILFGNRSWYIPANGVFYDDFDNSLIGVVQRTLYGNWTTTSNLTAATASVTGALDAGSVEADSYALTGNKRAITAAVDLSAVTSWTNDASAAFTQYSFGTNTTDFTFYLTGPGTNYMADAIIYFASGYTNRPVTITNATGNLTWIGDEPDTGEAMFLAIWVGTNVNCISTWEE